MLLLDPALEVHVLLLLFCSIKKIPPGHLQIMLQNLIFHIFKFQEAKISVRQKMRCLLSIHFHNAIIRKPLSQMLEAIETNC